MQVRRWPLGVVDVVYARRGNVVERARAARTDGYAHIDPLLGSDEAALRRGVWTYVGGERDAGVSPGHVIVALTRVIEEAKLAPHEQRLAVTRRVILWCVEAYFGHLGGDVVGNDERALSDTGAVRVR